MRSQTSNAATMTHARTKRTHARTPAQLTTALTGAPPNFSTMSSAARTSASDVTSVGEKTAPMEAATDAPALEGRSAITTLAAWPSDSWQSAQGGNEVVCEL
jgi:hypothetical protein